MQCKNCGKIIRDEFASCPYCRTPVVNDFFGYEQANNAINAQMRGIKDRPKDNSGKIVAIVLSAVAGVFGIILMLVFMMSSGSGDSKKATYEATVTVKPAFTLLITDSSHVGETFQVIVSEIAGNKTGANQQFELVESMAQVINLDEGSYSVKVYKTLTDCISIELVVDNSCQFSTLDLQYDKKQIYSTNGAESGLAGSGTAQPTVSEPATNADTSTTTKKYFVPTAEVDDEGYGWTCDWEGSNMFSVMLYASEYYEKYEFDDSGRILRSGEGGEGKPFDCFYEYPDEYTVKKTWTTYDTWDGELTGSSVSKYTDFGKLKEYSYENSFGYRYTVAFDYNEDNLCIKVSYIGKSHDGDHNEYYTMEYDACGNITKQNKYLGDTGKLVREVTYSYDPATLLLSEVNFSNNNNDKKGTSVRYYYDDSKRLIKIEYWSKNNESYSLHLVYEYKYDKNENVSEIHYNNCSNGSKSVKYLTYMEATEAQYKAFRQFEAHDEVNAITIDDYIGPISSVILDVTGY